MAKKTTYELCLRLNTDEVQKLQTDAENSGLSRSAYLRRLIMGAKIRPRPPKELQELYTEINRIGNNINQIARSVNAGIASPKTAEESLFLLHKIYMLMDKMANG